MPVEGNPHVPYDAVMDPDPLLINAVTWRIPNALVLIGSHHDGERNAMTASWVSQVAMDPVLIGVSIDATSVTHRLVSGSGVFSVNLWDADDARTFVKFSKPARDGGDTLNDRAVFAAPSGAPVFAEAIAWIDCAVRHRIDLGSHSFFAGEITALAQRDDEATVAAMTHTRMKYGGVARR